MKSLQAYVREELTQFEETVLKPQGEPPLDETEYSTYSALLSAAWASLALEIMPRLHLLAKQNPEAAPTLLGLAREILATMPEASELVANMEWANDFSGSGITH